MIRTSVRPNKYSKEEKILTLSLA